MQESHDLVSVLSLFDAEKRVFKPLKLKWRRRVYVITDISMHYTKIVQGTLTHFYSVASKNMLFVLTYNTKTLFWTVSDVVDLDNPA